ncbi:MAG: flagellar protein FlaG [Nitrospirae bacterium]|nr:flagellar protein FlaG [Nitrospirota bacterium]
MEIGNTEINYVSSSQQSDVGIAGANVSGVATVSGQTTVKDTPQFPDTVTISPQAASVQAAKAATPAQGSTKAADTSNGGAVTGSVSGNGAQKANGVLKQNASKQNASKQNEVKQKQDATQKGLAQGVNKAYFAVDDKHNVVIRIVDSQGKVVKQVPPEDYLKMVDSMKQADSHLFHTKA